MLVIVSIFFENTFSHRNARWTWCYQFWFDFQHSISVDTYKSDIFKHRQQ